MYAIKYKANKGIVVVVVVVILKLITYSGSSYDQITRLLYNLITESGKKHSAIHWRFYFMEWGHKFIFVFTGKGLESNKYNPLTPRSDLHVISL